MSIIIDGREIEVDSADKNIVDVATRAKISIPAPCYRNNRANGCCNACVVEIDGKEEYACVVSPKDGMSVTIDRDDLKELRKERLKIYQEAVKSGEKLECNCGDDCSDSDSDSDSGCGCGCGPGGC